MPAVSMPSARVFDRHADVSLIDVQLPNSMRLKACHLASVTVRRVTY